MEHNGMEQDTYYVINVSISYIGMEPVSIQGEVKQKHLEYQSLI